MLKSDKYILEHLSVYSTGLSDTYFCSIYYKNKEDSCILFMKK